MPPKSHQGKKQASGKKIDAADSDKAVQRYIATCARYNTAPCADVIVCLRYHLKTLEPSLPLTDSDVLALIDGCFTSPTPDEENENADHSSEAPAVWRHLRVIDLHNCKLAHAGATLIGNLLSTGVPIEALNLSGQRIGVYGAWAIAEGALASPTLRELDLRGCKLGCTGGSVFSDLIKSTSFDTKAGGSGHPASRLTRLNLANNYIGFETCAKLEKAHRGGALDLTLDGNRVLDEVFSAVSHGLGCVLCIPAAVALLSHVEGMGDTTLFAVSIYLLSLCTLFLGSTLYHSFFALGTTKRVFEAIDHCAIYLLIAGSYTPFLMVLGVGHEYMLRGMWLVAFVGMILHVKMPSSTLKTIMEVSLYLIMGWAAIFCLDDIRRAVGPDGMLLLMGGGIFYTVGVPFFIKNGRTFDLPDHTTWHVFVLLGAATHYLAIYHYVCTSQLVALAVV